MPLRNTQCFYQLHSLPCHPLTSEAVLSVLSTTEFPCFWRGCCILPCFPGCGAGLDLQQWQNPTSLLLGMWFWYPRETGICMERSYTGYTTLNGRAESHQEGFSYHFCARNDWPSSAQVLGLPRSWQLFFTSEKMGFPLGRDLCKTLGILMGWLTDLVPFVVQPEGWRRPGLSAASLGLLLPTNKWALAWWHWEWENLFDRTCKLSDFSREQSFGESVPLEKDKQQLFALLPTIGLKCKA